jgi:hypothetical protein
VASVFDRIDWRMVGMSAAGGALLAYWLFRPSDSRGTVDGKVVPGAPSLPVITPDMPFSQAIVQMARKDIGVTEQGGDNRGPRVEQMQATTGNRPGDAWCASAATTWVFEAADALKRKRPFRGSAGVKELVQQMQDGSNPWVGWVDAQDLRANPSLVQPGMLVMWSRSTYDSALGHVGVVQSAVNDKGSFLTIEGNAGAASDRVVTAVHPLSSGKLVGMGYFRDAAAVAGLGYTKDPPGVELFT